MTPLLIFFGRGVAIHVGWNYFCEALRAKGLATVRRMLMHSSRASSPMRFGISLRTYRDRWRGWSQDPCPARPRQGGRANSKNPWGSSQPPASAPKVDGETRIVRVPLWSTLGRYPLAISALRRPTGHQAWRRRRIPEREFFDVDSLHPKSPKGLSTPK